MKRNNHKFIRPAIQLHQQFIGQQQRAQGARLPTDAWANVQRLQRQIDVARQHGWHGATRRLSAELAYGLANCRRQLDRALHTYESVGRTPCQQVSTTDVYRDLLALEEEFGQVGIDLKEKELSVTTENIILEEIFLGPFQIKLAWDRIGQGSQPYRVIALDPHPAAKSDDITHPHVQDERLCEGEGHAAITAALAEGRLLDFFLLVSRVLHNYGRGNAFAELEDWEGEPCAECGSSVDPGERYFCHRCDAMLCDRCGQSCQGCEDLFCSCCLGTCAVCGNEYCSSCLQPCGRCCQRVCADCREGGLCRNCEDQPQEEQDHASTEELERETAATQA